MDAVALWNNIGTQIDIASSTGSIHAKLKALKSLPIGTATWGGVNSADSANTLLNITGSGFLLYIHSSDNTGTGKQFTIQVDGGTLKQFNLFGGQFFGLRFNTSLLVKSVSTPGVQYHAAAVLD